MKKLISGLYALLFAVSLMSCGDDKDSKTSGGGSSAGNGTYYYGSYEYEVNGCKTGKHTYNSREELCRQLQDEASNQQCAYSMRQEAYQNYCTNNGTRLPQAISGFGEQTVQTPVIDMLVVGRLDSRSFVTEDPMGSQTLGTLTATLQVSAIESSLGSLPAGDTLNYGAAKFQIINFPITCADTRVRLSPVTQDSSDVQLSIQTTDSTRNARTGQFECIARLRRVLEKGVQIHVENVIWQSAGQPARTVDSILDIRAPRVRGER